MWEVLRTVLTKEQDMLHTQSHVRARTHTCFNTHSNRHSEHARQLNRHQHVNKE
jgi:hypothetical protein